MRPTQAIVRLGAIADNLETASRFAPDAKIMPVIKANAYGQGAREVELALQTRVPAFALAFLALPIDPLSAVCSCPAPI